MLYSYDLDMIKIGVRRYNSGENVLLGDVVRLVRIKFGQLPINPGEMGVVLYIVNKEESVIEVAWNSRSTPIMMDPEEVDLVRRGGKKLLNWI